MRQKFNSKTLFSLLVVVALIGTIFNKLAAQQIIDGSKEDTRMEIAFIMFNDYETLDVFGPAEIFGRLVDKYSLKFYSLAGGIITNRHQVPILTDKLDANDMYLLPVYAL